MSKYQYRQSDIYLPGTEIPINRLGVEDGELLHAIEAELLDQASQLFLDELSRNGRITRLFFDLIALSNGYAPVDYSRALAADETDNNAYIRASIACVRYADIRPLEQLVLAGLSRLDTN